MSETAYIDQLLKAEKQAAEIIENAQKERQRKLKEAKEAAEAQVAKYRAEKAKEFQILRANKTDKKFETDLEKETQEQIIRIQQDYEKNKDKVIEMLVEKVLEVNLTIPNSVKEKFIKKK